MPARQSTSEDIQKILDACPIQPGALLSWAALEEILTPLTRHDRRFRTIYRAWIRHARKWHNRKIVVVRDQGLKILRENERASDVCTTIGRTWGIFEHAKQDVDDIQIVELSEAEVEETHFVRVSTHRLHKALQEERMRLAARPGQPLPTAPLPQRPLPVEA